MLAIKKLNDYTIYVDEFGYIQKILDEKGKEYAIHIPNERYARHDGQWISILSVKYAGLRKMLSRNLYRILPDR